jgi:hypothetical protein
MSRRTKGTWILAGLALMAAVSAGGGVVRAGTVGLKGHITPLPGGSPFLYEFELDLDAGQVAPGSSLTIGVPPKGLIGVNGLSGTSQPPTIGPSHTDIWVVPFGGIVTTGSGPYGTESSVTWDFSSGTTYNNSLGNPPVDVGQFNVQTVFSYPDNMPPSIPGVTIIDYIFKFADGSTQSGMITLTAVPEPSSVFLLLAGAGALPLLRSWINRSRSLRTG